MTRAPTQYIKLIEKDNIFTELSQQIDNQVVSHIQSVSREQSTSIAEMPEFDHDRFIRDLKEHEGVIYRIYPDPIHGASAPTLGVGHLVQPGDKHYGLPLHTWPACDIRSNL